ncbi:hypothetical protein GCE9029_00063 [Grimontia celer]|uniref:Uncharacterized protein n=1 Tax=Grimontia celer TaxID=1796497 RepID=A0A128ESS2_9GAMM|nr:hypothetical protein GCE9029_00063 [Grimontia celer]
MGYDSRVVGAPIATLAIVPHHIAALVFRMVVYVPYHAKSLCFEGFRTILRLPDLCIVYALYMQLEMVVIL